MRGIEFFVGGNQLVFRCCVLYYNDAAVSRATGEEAHAISILLYSLVYWEDCVWVWSDVNVKSSI